MIQVPAGAFVMGSPAGEVGRHVNEGPERKVAISAFAMGKFEVTIGEFRAFVAETKHDWPGDCLRNFVQDDDHPAVCVSWSDATSFVGWLKTKTGKAYRLPSEAEWEYAARAGTTSAFHTGATLSGDQANIDAKTGYAAGRIGIWRASTTPIGSFPPNDFGLHDMHGNAWEWVDDCYVDSHAGAPVDGRARRTDPCAYRVQRGGVWNYGPAQARSAARVRSAMNHRTSGNGLRVARDLD